MSRINLEDSILERPIVRTGMKYGLTILTDAASTTLDADMGPVIMMTPTVGRTLILPAVDASMRGLTFYIISGAAFTLTVRTATPTTVGVVPATIGATGMFVCTGNATGGGGIEGWIGGL
jgi:hypothetical protein